MREAPIGARGTGSSGAGVGSVSLQVGVLGTEPRSSGKMVSALTC